MTNSDRSPRPKTDDGLGRAQRELIGSRYREILRELTAIVSYQWKEHMERSALKGFLFHGGVGVGKTAMAKRLTYELCRRFGDNGATGRSSDEVVMILVDGADVARGRYGDTEEQIRDIFKYARDGQSGGHHRHDDDPKRRTIILVRRCRIAFFDPKLLRRERVALQPELDLLP